MATCAAAANAWWCEPATPATSGETSRRGQPFDAQTESMRFSWTREFDPCYLLEPDLIEGLQKCEAHAPELLAELEGAVRERRAARHVGHHMELGDNVLVIKCIRHVDLDLVKVVTSYFPHVHVAVCVHTAAHTRERDTLDALKQLMFCTGGRHVTAWIHGGGNRWFGSFPPLAGPDAPIHFVPVGPAASAPSPP